MLDTPGRPLDSSTRLAMELHFGYDFSKVRVHTDSRAAESAQSVDALAYTVRNDIAFGAGQYDPGDIAGKRLLAHELAHVIQQGAAGPLPTADAPGESIRKVARGRPSRKTEPMLRTDKGVQRLADTAPSTIAGLSSIEDVADALLAQAPLDQDPLLAELIQARADFVNTDTLQLPVSAAQKLGDIAHSAAVELPYWIPAPQIPDPVPASEGIAMAAVDPRIVIGIGIFIIVVLIVLFFLAWWLYTSIKEWLDSLTQATEPSTQPSEEIDTGEISETGDTGSAILCDLPGPAPNATDCGKGSCADSNTFCTPCQSEEGAKIWRDDFKETALHNIGGFVDTGVKRVWETYLYGGVSSPRNYSSDFANAFADSETSLAAADYLIDALEDSLLDDPPQTDFLSTRDMDDRIGALYGEDGDLEDPTSAYVMNFNEPKTIPGNLAGGAGTDQASCEAGAKPSKQKDQRRAEMEVRIRRIDSDFVEVEPIITFTVRDTVDLCPGDCGTGVERLATIPFSRFEATGISGDVPFVVEFNIDPDEFAFELKLPKGEGADDEQGVREDDTGLIPE